WKQFGRVLLAPGEDALHMAHFAGAIRRLASQSNIAAAGDALDAIDGRVPEAIGFYERDQQVVKKTMDGVRERLCFFEPTGSAEFVQFNRLFGVEAGHGAIAAFAAGGNPGEKVFAAEDGDVGSFFEHRFEAVYVAAGVLRADKSWHSMGELSEQFR